MAPSFFCLVEHHVLEKNAADSAGLGVEWLFWVEWLYRGCFFVATGTVGVG